MQDGSSNEGDDMGRYFKIGGVPNERHSRQSGFSLIELLIVVAIILIIAAIAIPNLLRAKMAANESSAVSTLRSMNTAEVTYATLYPALGYADTTAKLGGTPALCVGGAVPANACLIDDVVALAVAPATAKSGYYFTISGTNPAPTSTYTFTGLTVNVGTTGQRGFFTDQTGVLRYTTNGTAPTSVCSPIQ
jgi:type IV pilus assembly protein PilA